MKLKKVASKASKTLLNVGKLGFALELGDLRGVNDILLDTASTWGGKNNVLARAEGAVDHRLSKNRFYRVGKAATNLYFDATHGNAVESYKEGANLARQVLGKKGYRRSGLQKSQEAIDKYVLPAAQTVQDVYKIQQGVRAMPSAYARAYQNPSVRNAAVAGFITSGVASRSRNVKKALGNN